MMEAGQRQQRRDGRVLTITPRSDRIRMLAPSSMARSARCTVHPSPPAGARHSPRGAVVTTDPCPDRQECRQRRPAGMSRPAGGDGCTVHRRGSGQWRMGQHPDPVGPPRAGSCARASPGAAGAAGLHHHLVRQGSRTRVGLVGIRQRRDPHFALLIGYGAGAINPYLAWRPRRYDRLGRC